MGYRDHDLLIAWAAGLIEGEGSFVISTNRRQSIQLSSTDRDIIDRLYAAFGGHVYGPRKRQPNRKPIWDWRLTKNESVRELTLAVLPYLGERRTEQATRLLAALGGVENGEKTHCPQGHPYDEENTGYKTYKGHRSRHCRTCSRAANSRWLEARAA